MYLEKTWPNEYYLGEVCTSASETDHLYWNTVSAATLHKWVVLWMFIKIRLSQIIFSTGMYSKMWGKQNSHRKEHLNEEGFGIWKLMSGTLGLTYINMALLYCMIYLQMYQKVLELSWDCWNSLSYWVLPSGEYFYWEYYCYTLSQK